MEKKLIQEITQKWSAFLTESDDNPETNNYVNENGYEFINLTPHPLKLNNGTILPTSGTIARVSASFTSMDNNLICSQEFGSVSGLPSPKPRTFYVVSALVLAAVKETSGRDDVIAPATGHPDAKREGGLIVSVPGFVK